MKARSSAAPKHAPLDLISPNGKPVVAFENADVLEQWLSKHHLEHTGIWLRIFKKGSGRATVTYAEALDIALCYGWIDGQKRKGDEESFLQHFCPRGKRSVWSKINVGHIDRLTTAKRMRPAGLAAVEAAKKDGRWEAAYESSSTFDIPSEFTAALAESPKAAEFFATLNKANRYSIFYQLQSAKLPETKARRLKKFIEMLERGEKLH